MGTVATKSLFLSHDCIRHGAGRVARSEPAVAVSSQLQTCGAGQVAAVFHAVPHARKIGLDTSANRDPGFAEHNFTLVDCVPVEI